MKGDIISCALSDCNKSFTKKNNEHKYCSTSHRIKGNRRKKGKPDLPEFISGIKKVPLLHPLLYQQSNQASKSILRYLLAMVAGGWAAITQKSTPQILLIASAGYLVGNSVDKEKNRRLLLQQRLIPLRPPSQVPKINLAKPKPKSTRLMLGTDYRDAHIDSIGLKGKYHYLMGDPSAGFYAMVTGSPGHGKSTFSTQFAQYFQDNHGKVLYLASEQNGLNKPFQGLLKKVNATFTINTMPTSKVDEIIKDSKGFDLLVIDSINNLRLTPDDINQIKKAYPKLSVLAIMQSTKDGTFKGDQRFKHDCDIFMECKRPKVYQTKSRYAPPSDCLIFENFGND